MRMTALQSQIMREHECARDRGYIRDIAASIDRPAAWDSLQPSLVLDMCLA